MGILLFSRASQEGKFLVSGNDSWDMRGVGGSVFLLLSVQIVSLESKGRGEIWVFLMELEKVRLLGFIYIVVEIGVVFGIY